jgi:cyclopropane-fatty-acyl-phospholipid synthase
MDGRLTVEDGATCYDFIALAMMNLGLRGPGHWVPKLLGAVRWVGRKIAQYNPVPVAQRNVAHHYDLSGALYELFLDADRQYSCAYFARPDDSLETAQARKKQHIAAKLLLEPGQRVLDIGSGWGGLGLYLAEAAQVDVTGVTLSQEQHKVSNQRAATSGLKDRVRFDLRDYRQVQGRFDRIVSVGMFEHVGVNH